MGEPVVQVTIPLDALKQVPQRGGEAVSPADLRPLERGPADDPDSDRHLRPPAPPDAQLVDARIE